MGDSKKCYFCKYGEETASVKLSKNLREYGCSIIHVFNAEPIFSYTIGVEAMSGRAEVIVPFLEHKMALNLLNQYNLFIKNGVEFNLDEVYSDFLPFISVNVVFKKVLKSKYDDYLGRAVEFYGDDTFEAWQMVLPDKQGLFPWDDGCSEFFKREENIFFKKEW